MRSSLSKRRNYSASLGDKLRCERWRRCAIALFWTTDFFLQSAQPRAFCISLLYRSPVFSRLFAFLFTFRSHYIYVQFGNVHRIGLFISFKSLKQQTFSINVSFLLDITEKSANSGAFAPKLANLEFFQNSANLHPKTINSRKSYLFRQELRPQNHQL